ncbi:DNA adenine methylase [Lactobacillus sp. Sy-1]|uniref:DNA adenine methylase n=1 Tax=Lactobacillus sp. Sy-1 TaxID=2109645 RepID=UPI001C5AD35B|nr:DNA adenine methylase [Lactobacillus sp. Sy-1]MBW1606461.1 DNA adenine methylase [Lactobacillus sp. Sy-1]
MPNKNKSFNIQQRRYIGSKYKLMPWIKKLLLENTQGTSFFDVFAGTGSVTEEMLDSYDTFYINDFLYSNEIIFNAFFSNESYSESKLTKYKDEFNSIQKRQYDDSYFSDNFGNKYFSMHDAEVIGEIRERIHLSQDINKREKSILIASLIYSADSIANTVGHYDAYRKIKGIENKFNFRLIKTIDTEGKNIHIYRSDANELVSKISADIVFLDPPYNSRQYSRFYHILEDLAEWNKPELFGIALKPKPENMSDYSRTKAPEVFDDLVQNINAKYIAVTYNNTYEGAKSSSSRNKITHEQILESLNKVGKTQVFNKGYRFFNAGNTNLNNHSETLFITEV